MPDSLQAAFRHITSALALSAPREAYPHQTAVAEAMLSGRRVVLRAPAGSGKTLTAWLPWLASRIYRYELPPTMLHILPGGTFVDGLHAHLHGLVQPLSGLKAGVQTEGEAFDPFFLSDAVITTLDQMLSVALHRPLGLHPGLSNINAGVLLGSYLTFDEFPALQSREALVLWLGLLRRYYPGVPCLFMSATLPRPLLSRVAETLQAEFIDASAHVAGGRRSWLQLPGLEPEQLLRQHRGRTIVVCNTVRGAQTLYRALAAYITQIGVNVPLFLLHQYQFPRHRQPVEAQVAEIFGPGGSGRGLLITTSGCEVAADLSAEAVITDPAPPDALLRRAGRCGRFAGEEGRVIVARITDPTPGEDYPAPSHERLLATLADGATHTGADELTALDELWAQATPDEQPAALRDMPGDAEIDAAPERLLADMALLPDDLFRRVSVCLHHLPETVADPFELERLSLSVSSLERGWRQWRGNGCPGEWYALSPTWPRAGQRSPSWSVVEHLREFHAAARLLVLNADAVSYDRIIGLELAPGHAYQSERLPEQHTTWAPFDQHVERFEEHALRVLASLGHLTPWYRYVLRFLGKRWGLPALELEQWLRLVTVWHDAGKLTADWQRAAHRWQAETVRRPLADSVLARIDFDPVRDRTYPCPLHAPVGALAISRCLSVLFTRHPAVNAGTLAAISHHHGILPVGTVDLTPHPQAWSTLYELAGQVMDERQRRRLDRVGWTLGLRGLPDIPDAPPANPDAWMAYSLLVRAIRLADREVAIGTALG